jgi:hypothetical protein
MQRDNANLIAGRPAYVIGPEGGALTLESMPPPTTRRWVTRRKGEVVAAVRGGLLTADEACTRYDISLEELSSWQMAVDRSGLAGLRVTRTQEYRARYAREQRFG